MEMGPQPEGSQGLRLPGCSPSCLLWIRTPCGVLHLPPHSCVCPRQAWATPAARWNHLEALSSTLAWGPPPEIDFNWDGALPYEFPNLPGGRPVQPRLWTLSQKSHLQASSCERLLASPFCLAWSSCWLGIRVEIKRFVFWPLFACWTGFVHLDFQWRRLLGVREGHTET